ncbi:hypothetical protein EDD18DRAFT_856379 [Armillaria luteobubalina]|uniref:DUF6535 domain-containing protein n=1 Tax=Armillaria luteobubalina TaxID=153913 RepID=A0AA39QC61_9AGAR|nr:hypothetical protein EDD18DRAFT_856379 [Armillaria luteobubalina]
MQLLMSSPREPHKAPSSKWKGKAVDPTEHPNDGGNVDEADKDEDKGYAVSIVEENAQVNPPNPATSSNAKKTFGMHRAQPTARKGNDPSNYEDRFPEDPMYEETTPNARVWLTHQAESAIHDANMVEEIRDNVDVLLVFAGLFSAVVTTFVVQTSQNLQTDYAQVSASLLFELLLAQRAIANGSPIETIPVSSLDPQAAFVPAATDVWVNGLWFTSLFLSLTTALIAVLVKQWLHHYVVLPSGTPRERCFVRQYRYLGFQKWRVEVIVGVLPVLMHLALALFFIGLSLFLHPLRAALSWVVWTGTVLLIVAYVIVTILPMYFSQCPYRTPLCDLAYPPCIFVTSVVQKNYLRLRQLLRQCPYRTPLFNLASSPYVHVMSLVQKHYCQLRQHWRYNLNEPDSMNDIRAEPNSLKQLELEAVEKASLRLSVEALQWLLSASSNPAVQSIVVESIGGLPMAAGVELQNILNGNPSIVDVQRNLLLSLTGHNHNHTDWLPSGMIPSGMERKFERLLRSGMFMPGQGYLWVTINVPEQPDRDEFGATLVTQIPTLCPIWYPGSMCEPGVFLHDILSLETPARFAPIVWANLIQWATASGDPNLFSIDKFPIFLCSAMTESIVGADNPKQHLFTSPLVVEFHQAAEYFPVMALEYMMRYLLPFDRLPGERLGCRVLAASIHLMIHRLSQLAAGPGIAGTLESRMLRSLLGTSWRYALKNSEDVWKILESVIVDTPIFRQNATDSRYDDCSSWVLGQVDLLQNNFASHIHPSSSALHVLVTFMTTRWSTLRTSTRTSGVLCYVACCLRKRIRPAYDVFCQQQCLKFLAKQPVSSWSASLLEAYVIGIAAAIHPSRGEPEENQTILQAIDCLHEPENLFPVCSTLAMYTHWDGWDKRPLEESGIPDIFTALAQIRSSVPTWDTCRQRLRELADAQSFSVVITGGEEPDIRERRCNIRKAVKTLDRFFSDIPPQTTAILKLVQFLLPSFLLGVAEETLARATIAATSVLVRLCRLPITFKLASTVATG